MFQQRSLDEPVTPTHPLASETRTFSKEVLAEDVQLALTDPANQVGPSYSVVSPRVWGFVDLSTRLDVLRAGFWRREDDMGGTD